MDDIFYDIDNSLGFLTISVNRLMSAYFRKQLGDSGLDLTAEQWGVLVQLWTKGSITQDELAYILCVDKSSLSRVLDGMERRGLVVRTRDPGDARRKILFTSQKADAVKGHCRKVAEASMDQLLRDISPQELAICLRVLAKVKDIIRESTE